MGSELSITGGQTESFQLDRRGVLKLAGGGILSVGLVGTLAGCHSSSTSSTTSGAQGKPKRGGTLRVGLTGGGTSETLDPHNMVVTTDLARKYMLYDQLVESGNNGANELRLARAITPNANATEWTILLRPGVKFHDGSPLTADTILWNFERIKKNKFPGGASLGPIDLNRSRATNDTTLVLRFGSPYAQLVDNLAVYNFGVIPKTFDPKRPVGTGPFKFQSFTAGTESTMVRNDAYWESGLPYLDKIVLTDVADETTQVNGLQSGQFDVVGFLSAASTSTLESAGFNVIISESGGFCPFIMKTDEPPFNDVRVRQAFKLIMDRGQLARQVFGGHGKIGNDVTSPFDPMYDTGLKQTRKDVAKAKQLLAEAGHANMTINLYTCTGVGPGAVGMAQVYAQQAATAGIKVKVVQQETTAYFTDTYKKVPFSMEYWQYLPYMAQAGQSYLPDSPWNSTWRKDKTYNALYEKASAAADPSVRKPIIQEMMKFDHDQGGYIIPIFIPVIDAWSSKVGGARKSVTAVTPGGANWAHYWLAT